MATNSGGLDLVPDLRRACLGHESFRRRHRPLFPRRAGLFLGFRDHVRKVSSGNLISIRANRVTARTGRRIVSVTVVLAVIAAALLIFQLIRSKVLTTTTRSVASIASTVSAKSVAVLPLVNTSGDPSNEYFSDGLSEELIAVLAKIPDLKVIGRSSSFLFKGKSGDSGAIGQKLGVAHLIEGSVRKQGSASGSSRS